MDALVDSGNKKAQAKTSKKKAVSTVKPSPSSASIMPSVMVCFNDILHRDSNMSHPVFVITGKNLAMLAHRCYCKNPVAILLVQILVITVSKNCYSNCEIRHLIGKSIRS